MLQKTFPNVAKASSHTAYRADIDGLRAIAVLSVLLFHADNRWLPGGFAGVDVFFVISGYLITQVILRELRDGTFTIARFYERRARRILPALLVVSLTTLTIGGFFMIPEDYSSLGVTVLSALFFSSNLVFSIKFGNYFSNAADEEIFLHSWSLGVEEQFYIVFPILMILIWRHWRAGLSPILLAICAVSLAIAQGLVAFDQVKAFYLPFSRAWELGIGAVVAAVPLPAVRGRRLAETLSAAAVAVILVTFVAIDRDTPFPGVTVLPLCAAVGVLIHINGTVRTTAGRILSLSPFVAVGLISYSLYLWHWPLLALTRYRFTTPAWPETWPIAVIVVSFVLSYLTYRFVETPFRSRARIDLRRLVVWLGTSAAALAAFAGALIVTQGARARLSPEVAMLAAASGEVGKPACLSRGSENRVCLIGAPGVEPSFLVWGDSHASAMSPGVDQAARAAGVAGYVAARNACMPTLGISRVGKDRCRRHNQRTLKLIEQQPALKTLIFIGRWPMYFTGHGINEGTEDAWRLTDHMTGEPGSNPELYARGIKRVLHRIAQLDRRVVVVGSVPEYGWLVPRANALNAWYDKAYADRQTRADYERRGAEPLAAWRKSGEDVDLTLLPMGPSFCDDRCITQYRGYSLYSDGDHLSRKGARMIAAPVLSRIFAATPGNS